MNQSERFPFPVLIGDIGGTNARFALLDGETAGLTRLPTVHTADFATIDDAIQATVIDGAGARPRSAMLALAGPIIGDRVPLTNCDWVVEPKRAIARFGLSDVILLNDFEAQSLALPGLTDADLDPIGTGGARPDAIRIVLGPGTGLGVCALIHTRGTWVPVPGEGPHIDLGPVSERDFAIWPNLERVQGRITAEAVISGPGMLRLYRAICQTDGLPARQESPEAVTAAGLSGADPQAVETLALFSTHLGRVAGDLALLFLAHGGVYLAGTIAGKIAPALKAGGFRHAFEAKAPLEAIVKGIRTAIIVKNDAPLVGVAAYARAPERFGLDLSGRRWRG